MALLLKDGLIQVRLPQADVDRFRSIVEERSKTTASESIRRWIYRIIEEDDKRLLEASRRSGAPVDIPVLASSVGRVQVEAVGETRPERRRREAEERKQKKRGE